MSKQQEFGLIFSKWLSPVTNQTYNLCQKNTVDQYGHLQILSRFDTGTTQYLITQINNAENNLEYDSTPISESYDDQTIEIDFPNIVINDALTISEGDFKELLQEWLTFIS